MVTDPQGVTHYMCGGATVKGRDHCKLRGKSNGVGWTTWEICGKCQDAQKAAQQPPPRVRFSIPPHRSAI